MKRRLLLIVLVLMVSLSYSAQVQAGFAFFGTGRVLVVQPNWGWRTLPSFTAAPPTDFVSTIWRIRAPNQQFFPVPNGVPLVQDRMNLNGGVVAFNLQRSWGFWDPDMIDIFAEIPVVEIFTALDVDTVLSTVPRPGNLVDVDDYLYFNDDGTSRPLSVDDIPSEYVYQKPLPLPDESSGFDIAENTIVGNRTGTQYTTTVVDTTFGNLSSSLSTAIPGNSFDLSYFGDLINSQPNGRVIFSYANVPAGEVIMYGEAIPEPTTLIIWSLLGTVAITVGWWRRRV
jgi:hypothetical protein